MKSAPVRVKICGITNVDDARAAMDFGADAIGVIFADSRRRVTEEEAAQISRAVGPWISVLGVFVDESAAEMKRIARDCGLSAVQLHGRETPRTVASMGGIKVVKAFHVGEGFRPGEMTRYKAADAFLFDTKVPGLAGGTGVSFDWSLLKGFRSEKPFIISGGLHAGNVADAIRHFRPYGVETASGVETVPGRKDRKKMRDFIRNAKKV